MTLVTLMIFSSINAQVLNDTVVYDYLKSVQISPEGEPLDFPAYELGARKGLELSFDDLAYEWNNYSYRIFHCTKNWEKSDLLVNQYLIGFEGNYMNNFAISVGTFVPYTHYSIKFPNAETKPRVSGNYVIEIFQNDDPEDLIIRRRFIVYESLVIPGVSVSRAVDMEEFSTQQQVSATVSLAGYPVQDYFMDLDLSILQNRRWNNAKNNLKPTFINDGPNGLIGRVSGFQIDGTGNLSIPGTTTASGNMSVSGDISATGTITAASVVSGGTGTPSISTAGNFLFEVGQKLEIRHGQLGIGAESSLPTSNLANGDFLFYSTIGTFAIYSNQFDGDGTQGWYYLPSRLSPYPLSLPNLSNTQRNAITGKSGHMIFNTDSGNVEVHDGSAWRTISI